MLAKFLIVFVMLIPLNAISEVRYNPVSGLWEGNVCMTQYGWAFVNYQPIGSICTVHTPAGPVKGRIVNG